MTGKTVLEHSHPNHFQDTPTHINSSEEEVIMTSEKFYTPIEVATAVTFIVAIYQVKKLIKQKFSIYIQLYFYISSC